MFTAKKQIAPATSPIAIAGIGPTNPDAGVVATSPATAPDGAPTVVARLCLIHSGISHPNTAAAVASWVATNADPARPFAASADPPLNPNHPNHRIAAPRITSGTLCGRNPSVPNPRRLPM